MKGRTLLARIARLAVYDRLRTEPPVQGGCIDCDDHVVQPVYQDPVEDGAYCLTHLDARRAIVAASCAYVEVAPEGSDAC